MLVFGILIKILLDWAGNYICQLNNQKRRETTLFNQAFEHQILTYLCHFNIKGKRIISANSTILNKLSCYYLFLVFV